jgi:hypothetical protein
MQWAVLILNTPNPTLKARTRHFFGQVRTGFNEQYYRLGVLVMRYIYTAQESLLR